MKQIFKIGLLTVAVAFPAMAQAEGAGGSRQQAGGGFMSSYVDDPYHDPRSLHSQRMGRGQILGALMLSENAGAQPTTLLRADGVHPRWTAGTAPRAAR